jgi:hypothetical protein
VVNSAEFGALARDAGLPASRTPPADGVPVSPAVPAT